MSVRRDDLRSDSKQVKVVFSVPDIIPVSDQFPVSMFNMTYLPGYRVGWGHEGHCSLVIDDEGSLPPNLNMPHVDV